MLNYIETTVQMSIFFMRTEVYKNIFKIEIPLPKNPLKLLNSYLNIKEGE